MDEDIKKLNDQAESYAKELQNLRKEMGSVIVGQEDVVGKVIMALIAQGHVLIQGVPGLAKTLMVRTMAGCLDAGFVRLQFTPDLLPSDIVGTKIYNQKSSEFLVKKGPIFSNLVLADEINRAPPKVQSALLEAMQERQVTIQGDTFELPRPFLVLATQNPIESEGTYCLPEAQVDRFMFNILISYPKKDDEKEIIRRFTIKEEVRSSKVLGIARITQMQSFCRSVYADEKITDYVTDIVDATRNPKLHGLELSGYIDYGASPRASLWLIIAAKANALLQGRGYVIPEDVVSVAHDVLRHRIMMSYEAEAEGVTSDEIIKRILSKVKVP